MIYEAEGISFLYHFNNVYTIKCWLCEINGRLSKVKLSAALGRHNIRAMTTFVILNLSVKQLYTYVQHTGCPK